MRETKVNLKHLLEDIRDSYTIPLEEIIVVELVANALDSGAGSIAFFIDSAKKTFTVVDNGKGMRREVLADYHNIAATTKIRGKGIGFAGVGAKLSLLVADAVVTEAKGGYGSRCATTWRLNTETSAPWKFVPFLGKVTSPRGAAVSINLPNNFPLLDEQFIIRALHRHFYPLFHFELFGSILKHIYKKGVEFSVNNKKIIFSHKTGFAPIGLQIKTGKGRHKTLAGAGYLMKTNNPKDIFMPGLAVSTYGKIIKSGWEWLGVDNKEDRSIYGVIEIPALAEILTTNKMDFLKDQASLKKYYNYRKTIQQAVIPILEELGEGVNAAEQQKSFRSLANEIERALRYVLGDFPELAPLLGIRQSKQLGPDFISSANPLISINSQSNKAEEKDGRQTNQESQQEETPPNTQNASAKSKTAKKGKRSPAISIGFEARKQSNNLARMIENKIWINNAHPAYIKAKENKQEPYHIVFCTALALSNFLENNRSPQEFINNFFSCWGKGDKRNLRLFKA